MTLALLVLALWVLAAIPLGVLVGMSIKEGQR